MLRVHGKLMSQLHKKTHELNTLNSRLNLNNLKRIHNQSEFGPGTKLKIQVHRIMA